MDISKSQIEQFVTGVGALAEIAGALRDALLKVGYTREEAVTISGTVLTNVFNQAFSNNGGKK